MALFWQIFAYAALALGAWTFVGWPLSLVWKMFTLPDADGPIVYFEKFGRARQPEKDRFPEFHFSHIVGQDLLEHPMLMPDENRYQKAHIVVTPNQVVISLRPMLFSCLRRGLHLWEIEFTYSLDEIEVSKGEDGGVRLTAPERGSRPTEWVVFPNDSSRFEHVLALPTASNDTRTLTN